MVRKTTPGALSRLPNDPKYTKDYNTKRRSEDKGERYFPSAKHTRSQKLMTSLVDTDFITIMLNHENDNTRFGDLMTNAWKYGMKTGNLKEASSTEYEAFELLCENWWLILMNLGPQVLIMDLMDNPPRSNLVTDLGDGLTTNVAVAMFEDADLNPLLQELERLEIPTVVVELFKIVHFYIQWYQPYAIGSVNYPGSYLCPWIPYRSLSTVKSAKTVCYSNLGLAKNHMDKFGIKYQPFKTSMLEARKIEMWDDDFISYISQQCLNSRAGAADIRHDPPYPLDAAAGANVNSHALYFNANGFPDDSKLNVLIPFFYSYVASYNIYGGVLDGASVIPSTNTHGAIRAMKSEGTEFLGVTIVKSTMLGHFFTKFLAAVTDEANLCLSITGDYTGGDSDLGESYWQAAVDHQFQEWSGFSIDQYNNTLLQLTVDVMF